MMDTKEEVKKDNFATVAEAVKGAGTTVLSHLDSGAHKLTHQQVSEVELENHLIGEKAEGEYRAYAGPYTDALDERNSWTAAQETGETERTRDLTEDNEAEEGEEDDSEDD